MFEEKETSIATIVLIILKELRLELGMKQAHVSTSLGYKTTASYCKIENGDTVLNMTQFFAVCRALDVNPTCVLGTAEIVQNMLCTEGWKVLDTFEKDDLLLRNARQYWENTPDVERGKRLAVVCSIVHNRTSLHPVFTYND